MYFAHSDMFRRTLSNALIQQVQQYGHESTVRMLLELKADVNAADE
jgi:hypothetical protein